MSGKGDRTFAESVRAEEQGERVFTTERKPNRGTWVGVQSGSCQEGQYLVFGRVGYLEAVAHGWSYPSSVREAEFRLRMAVKEELDRAGEGARVEWVNEPIVASIVDTSARVVAQVRIVKADGTLHHPPAAVPMWADEEAGGKDGSGGTT